MSSAQVGIRLREERARLDLSQESASVLAGVRREQWSRYESGAMPGGEALLRLLGHGFDVNYILGGSRTIAPGAGSDTEAHLVADFRDTDNEGRAAITRTARLEADRVRRAKP